MYQSTTPSLLQTIWPRWASRQLLTLPIVKMLLPMTFAYSLSSRKNLESVVMRQLRRWKRLWLRSLTRSHKRTSMGPSRSCWNFEEDYSFMCVLSIKVPIRKKPGNLLCTPCILWSSSEIEPAISELKLCHRPLVHIARRLSQINQSR